MIQQDNWLVWLHPTVTLFDLTILHSIFEKLFTRAMVNSTGPATSKEVVEKISLYFPFSTYVWTKHWIKQVDAWNHTLNRLIFWLHFVPTYRELKNKIQVPIFRKNIFWILISTFALSDSPFRSSFLGLVFLFVSAFAPTTS